MDKLSFILAAAALAACSKQAAPGTAPGASFGGLMSPTAQGASGSSAAALPAASTTGTSASPQAATQSQALDLGPLQAGYQRFETPAIEVAAGESNHWAQWVGGPLDQDYDVLDIHGIQSRGGHHAILYATPDKQPVGFTRVWQDSDQLKTRMMGGIGGEAGGSLKLPDGVVFRVKKGSYLVVQTHYLNVSDQPLTGRTILDMKLGPTDPSHRVASIFANATTGVSLPAGQKSTLDVTCPLQQDLSFLEIANHMHEYGKSAFTELIDARGTKQELKRDDVWDYEWALNPNFEHFPVDSPMIVRAGSTLHTQCTWANTTDKVVTFPTEMCVFAAFILSEADIYCTAGQWSVAGGGASSSATAGNSVGGGSAGIGGNAGIGMGGNGTGGSSPSASDAGTAPARGACLSNSDQAGMKASDFDQKATTCGTPCAFDPDLAGCVMPCLVKDIGLSSGCAACAASHIACTGQACLTQCAADTASPDCRSCADQNCGSAYHACTGL
jgi:hypothetical protein